jgi:hypothetical protein
MPILELRTQLEGAEVKLSQINLQVKLNHHQHIGTVSRVRRRISQSTGKMKENSKKILRPKNVVITPAEAEAEVKAVGTDVVISVKVVKPPKLHSS